MVQIAKHFENLTSEDEIHEMFADLGFSEVSNVDDFLYTIKTSLQQSKASPG